MQAYSITCFISPELAQWQKRRSFCRAIPLVFFLLFLTTLGTAQTTLQVVTKTVRKTAPWKPGYALEINSEKAEIEVETAPAGQNVVTIRAELTARHPNLDSAQHDLKAWKFVVSTIGKKIYVRAYVGLPNGVPLPTSNLKAKIVVQAPAECATTLANKYGSATLGNRKGAIRLSGEFCTFSLTEISGAVQIDSRYGNVDGRQLSGNVDIQAKRADVALSGLSGDCAIRNEYGTVRLDAGPQTGNVTVDASKSDVTLHLPLPYHHNLDLKANHGAVKTPFAFSLDAGASVTPQSATLHQGNQRPRISVQTNIGNITVE